MVDAPPIRVPDAARSLFLAFRAELDSVADRVFEALLVRIPIATSLPAEVVADVRERMTETLALTLDHMAADTPLASLTERVRSVAVHRANAGIPLEVTILAHEIAADVLTDLAIERLAEDGAVDAAMLTHTMRRAMRVLQAATMGVAAGYEQVAVAVALSRQHEQQALLEALFAGRSDTDEAMAAAQRGGADVRFQWAAAARTDEAAGMGLRRRYPAALVGELNGWAVLLSATEPVELPAGAGIAPADPADLGSALRRAMSAAEVATHLGADRWDGVAAAPFAGVLAIPAADRDDFVRATLGPLASSDADLLATLVCYLSHGLQRTASARALHVHRHTLDRRLARIDQLLPLDLADAPARLRVQLALFLIGRFPTA